MARELAASGEASVVPASMGRSCGGLLLNSLGRGVPVPVEGVAPVAGLAGSDRPGAGRRLAEAGRAWADSGPAGAWAEETAALAVQARPMIAARDRDDIEL